LPLSAVAFLRGRLRQPVARRAAARLSRLARTAAGSAGGTAETDGQGASRPGRNPEGAGPMNNLGITLVGVAVQVTLVALVAAVLYGVMARRGPEAGSLTARLGLVGIVALTFVAFVPLPRWWNWSASRERASPVDFAASEVTAEPMLDVEKKTTAAETPHESGGGSGWSLAGLRGLLARLSRDKEAAPEKSWSGPWFVAVLFLVGLTLCLLRLLWALWAVRGF